MGVSALPAWINGHYCESDTVQLSINDLGVIHADSTYDTWLILQGRAFMMPMAWARFTSGAGRLGLIVELTLDQATDITRELLRQAPDGNYIACAMITRGVPGSLVDIRNARHNVMIVLKPVPDKFPTGTASACIAESARRIPDRYIDQRSKSVVWTDLTRAQFEALDRGYDIGILLSETGQVSEGYATGVCCYRGQDIYSPAANRVDSTTITALEQASARHGWRFQYQDISPADLYDADGIILASISGLCVQVTRLGDKIYDPLDYKNKLFNEWILADERFFTDLKGQ